MPPTVERVSYMADAGRASARWRRSGAQPYGPEHAYRSSRVRTIETRIDPAIPIPFEKNTNILQANSAWPRSFQIGKTLEVARADAGIRFDETIRLRSDRRIIFIAPALRSMQPRRGGNARSRGLFAVQDEHHRRRSATEREAPLGVPGQTSKARPAHAGLCDYRRWTRRSDRRDLSGAVPARGGPG
jgi:hypothetical protein